MMNPEESFRASFEASLQTYLKKNTDYGNAWQMLGARGVFVRWFDKNQRAKQLLWHNQDPMVTDESLRDTIQDALLYNLMLLYLLDQGNLDGAGNPTGNHNGN